MNINTYCSLVIIMMLGLVVSDPPTPYPYYESTNSSTPFPPSLPCNSQSPNLANGRKNSSPPPPVNGRKKSSPPPPSKLPPPPANGRKKSSPPPPSKLPPPPPPVVHFDFFKWVEQWPKTFCFTKTCRTDIQPKFVIHGMWPSIKASSASQPENCSKTGIDFFNFPPRVFYQIRTEWPSLIYEQDKKSEDINFWNRQWKKHGSCSSMNGEDYFKLTLDIHKRKILKDVLEKKGILPDTKKTLPREDIFNAIKEDIQAKPEILCIKYKNNYYVKEIRMCLDKTNDHKYIDCPRDYIDCPINVYFP